MEEIKNNNPLGLTIGQTIQTKYLPCDMPWIRGMVTRITDMGYPWVQWENGQNGILSGDSYKVSLDGELYTKEEMIHFGKFAKSYRSSRIVENSFEDWKKLDKKN